MSKRHTTLTRSTAGGLAVAGVLAMALLAPSQAGAAEVKIGALWGLTGPVSQFIPPLRAAAELAASQINGQGGILKGDTVSIVYADSKCDPQTSSAAANKLVNINNVVAINGALCSGATIAAANSVTVPAGVAMISPASTSPAISSLEDKDTLFRVVPSDAFQGKVLARVLLERGIKNLAVTYIQNDYGKGLADALKTNFEANGGKVSAFEAHEPKKSSYRSEIATMKGGGAERLVVIAYAADSGPVIIRQALEGGLFNKFVGTDGVNNDEMIGKIGWDNLQGMIITNPGALPGTPAEMNYASAMKAASADSYGKPFAANTYDATFMLALAVEKAGSTDRAKVRAALREIAGPAGEVVLPGEWAKAKKLISEGKAINYEGAAGPHDFDAAGDVPGVIDVFEVKGKERAKVATIDR